MSGVAAVLDETLRQLSERRRKLEPFVEELADLDIVERDLRKTAAKLRKRHSGSTHAPPQRPSSAPEDGGENGAGGRVTHRQRVAAVLSEHPAGLSGARIAELAGIEGKQIYVLLSAMATGPDAVLERVGRGFYRQIRDVGNSEADATLSEEEREELGDRAVA